MSDISTEAQDLLTTLKRIPKSSRVGGEFVAKRLAVADYGQKQNSKELDPLFDELEAAGYIKKQSPVAYRLLAKALNQGASRATSVVNNNFSDINNSNIANMSPNVQQTLDLSNYSAEIQKEVAELQEAIGQNDDTRAKRIIDGLWVSAPQLVLSVLQLGSGCRMVNNGSMGDIDYSKPEDYNRFVDEAGDTTFFKKGKVPVAFGEHGVSRYLILGMVHVKNPLPEAEQKIREFSKTIEQDEFFMAMPSVRERIATYGYFLPHAKDDPAEIKLAFFRFLAGDDIQFSAQAVLGRKSFERFAKAHDGRDREFYADLLAYILHDKASYEKLVVNVAERGNTTGNANLEASTGRAKQRYKNRYKNEFGADIRYNVQPYATLPIFSIVDYSLWAIQRLVERGDDKYYKLISDKVPHVYDAFASEGVRRHFTRENPLSPEEMEGRL